MTFSYARPANEQDFERLCLKVIASEGSAAAGGSVSAWRRMISFDVVQTHGSKSLSSVC